MNEQDKAIFRAAADGNIEQIKSYLEQGGNINTRHKGMTLLMTAALLGQSEVVQLLVSKGADINAINSNGKTALQLATVFEHEEIIQCLIKNSASIDNQGRNVNNMLVNAVLDEDIKLVERFANSGVNLDVLDEDDCTPLMLAAERGYNDIVNLLIANGADIGYTLSLSAYNNNTSTIIALLNRGFDIEIRDQQGRTPLMSAVSNPFSRIPKLLLDKGANIEAIDDDNNTPIMVAILDDYENIDMVKLLIKMGANVNVCNKNGETPLIKATYFGYTKIVRLLLKSGANIEQCDNDGNNAMYFAKKGNHTKIIKLLDSVMAH